MAKVSKKKKYEIRIGSTTVVGTKEQLHEYLEGILTDKNKKK